MTEQPEKVIVNDSGAQELIGYEVRIFADRTEAHLPLGPQHLNRRGYMHGGLFSLLLDSCCGYAASRAFADDASQLVVTLSLTTNYLAPADGSRLKAVGRVDRAGRSIAFASGEIYNDRGDIIATGTAAFKTAGPGR